MKKEIVSYRPDYIAFDIETTSTVINGRKSCWCWHWQIMFNGKYYTPNSWEKFWDIVDSYGDENERCIIWVHNLGYEFEYLIRNNCGNVLTDFFASDVHRPLYVVFDNKIEFRCSYMLTNKSLALCGEDVGIQKGKDFDYRKIRYPGYKCTPEEDSYCYKDVEIVIAKIKQLEKMEKMRFWEFPLTNTGFIRRELRYAMRQNDLNYYLFRDTRLNGKTFKLCKDAFMGGYTHANYRFVGQVLKNLDAFDYGSAYPFAMFAYKYPMSKWHYVKKPTKAICFPILKDEDKLSILKIRITGVESITDNHFLSQSKCKVDVCTVDNGRIVSANELETTVTCLDFKIINRTYQYESIAILEFIWADADYLPEEIIRLMLKYYNDKNRLKGVEGEEENYMKSKNRLNSFFGMLVQLPIQPDTLIGDDYTWSRVKVNFDNVDLVAQKLNDFYNNKNSFLPYQWGVFVPAYTRYNLWSFITYKNRQGDSPDKYSVYFDTDSAKCKHSDVCIEAIDRYNREVKEIVNMRCKMLGIDNTFPDLGRFDREPVCLRFKTLGAKKYIKEYYDDKKKITKIETTVSGLSKKAVAYMGKNPFKVFTSGTVFADDVSGRTSSDFIINEVGAPDNGGCYMENCEYTLNMQSDFMDFTGCYDTSEYWVSKSGVRIKRKKGGRDILIDIDKLYEKGMI